MSLILDALRKSEAERRRGQTPDLYASLPPAVAIRRRQWLRWWPALALAGAAAVALAAFLLGRDEVTSTHAASDETASPTAAAPLEASPMRAATHAPAAAEALVAPAAPSASAVLPTSPAARKPPAVAEATAMQRAQAAAAAVAPPAVTAPPSAVPDLPDATTPAEEALPPIAVLSAGERAALPPLKLSMHVFASEPAKRFAIIDGQRVTEGSSLGAGVVEQIRRDGVVLDINGRRVLLPRP